MIWQLKFFASEVVKISIYGLIVIVYMVMFCFFSHTAKNTARSLNLKQQKSLKRKRRRRWHLWRRIRLEHSSKFQMAMLSCFCIGFLKIELLWGRMHEEYVLLWWHVTLSWLHEWCSSWTLVIDSHCLNDICKNVNCSLLSIVLFQLLLVIGWTLFKKREHSCNQILTLDISLPMTVQKHQENIVHAISPLCLTINFKCKENDYSSHH